jgi:hypothetical protein
MLNWYVQLVQAHPIWTAMVQFAILGTFGEIVSKWIIAQKAYMPFKIRTVILKMVEWALLAVGIKYAFAGFPGFIDSLVEHGLLPELSGIGRSFVTSVFINMQFGIFLVIMHRVLDNVIARQVNWGNLDKALISLLWFWIPAHTITFLLPKPYQIGLAALWSVALGIILGFFNRRKQ